MDAIKIKDCLENPGSLKWEKGKRTLQDFHALSIV
jgi:hypothetical protein